MAGINTIKGPSPLSREEEKESSLNCCHIPTSAPFITLPGENGKWTGRL